MEKTIGSGAGGIVAVVAAALVVAVAANCVSVSAQMYTCWGGCYNECFLRSNKTRSDGFACYYQCLNSCVPRSPADYQYYCLIGCNLELCTPFSNSDNGGRLEKCFGNCVNLCKF